MVCVRLDGMLDIPRSNLLGHTFLCSNTLRELKGDAFIPFSVALQREEGGHCKCISIYQTHSWKNNRLSTNRHGHIHPVRTLSGVSAHRVYRQDVATANASLSTDRSIFFLFFFDCTTANQDAQVSHPSLQR